MLGFFRANSHKINQKLSLHQIAHLYNGHILQIATSVYKLHLKFTGLLCHLYSKDALLREGLSRFFKS